MILFSYGYGLTYKDNINLEDLSESLPSQRKSKLGEVFLQGWPTDQYRVILQSPSEAFADKKLSITKDDEISSEIIDGKVQEDTHRVKIKQGISGWFLTTKNLNLLAKEASGILTFDFKVNVRVRNLDFYFRL